MSAAILRGVAPSGPHILPGNRERRVDGEGPKGGAKRGGPTEKEVREEAVRFGRTNPDRMAGKRRAPEAGRGARAGGGVEKRSPGEHVGQINMVDAHVPKRARSVGGIVISSGDDFSKSNVTKRPYYKFARTLAVGTLRNDT